MPATVFAMAVVISALAMQLGASGHHRSVEAHDDAFDVTVSVRSLICGPPGRTTMPCLPAGSMEPVHLPNHLHPVASPWGSEPVPYHGPAADLIEYVFGVDYEPPRAWIRTVPETGGIACVENGAEIPVEIHEGGVAGFCLRLSYYATEPLVMRFRITPPPGFVLSRMPGVAETRVHSGYLHGGYTILVVDDDRDTPDGTMTVELLPGRGYVVGSPSVVEFDLIDNDPVLP